MRKFPVVGLAALLLLVAFSLEVSAQGYQRGGKKNRGGGPQDPGRLFDMLAQGKSAIVIADVKVEKFRASLREFAQENDLSDGQITREQFTQYFEWFQARMAGGVKGASRKGRDRGPSEGREDKSSARFDRGRRPPPGVELKPVGARDLPEGLPEWFKQYDTNRDGQVSLSEWHKAGQPVDRFLAMDRNGDGYLTADEVLFYLSQSRPAAEKSAAATGYGP
jgi:Ca2+-binding EF-hand superfamily protein